MPKQFKFTTHNCRSDTDLLGTPITKTDYMKINKGPDGKYDCLSAEDLDGMLGNMYDSRNFVLKNPYTRDQIHINKGIIYYINNILNKHDKRVSKDKRFKNALEQFNAFTNFRLNLFGNPIPTPKKLVLMKWDNKELPSLVLREVRDDDFVRPTLHRQMGVNRSISQDSDDLGYFPRQMSQDSDDLGYF